MTLARLGLAWRRVSRRMWFRASIYGLLGVLTALAGAVAKGWIPDRIAGAIGADSVGNLLAILASSMLAVTTFSLSTMVSAYGAASSGATPRATRLLIADSSAQGALATFIGAFLFSVVGLVALSTGIYGDSGRVILFAATILVIILITITLLAWIEQLSSFGRLGATVDLIERATREAIDRHLEAPLSGAAAGADIVDATARAIPAGPIGYVEHIDIGALAGIAEEAGGTVHVAARPGTFVAPGRPLAWVAGGADWPEDQIRDAFAISDERSFDQDPRYGFVVLTEIGSRALSPSTNDPGTAIDVIGTIARLMCHWAREWPAGSEVRHSRVFMPPLRMEDVFDDVFPQLGRDGAHMREVGIRLQKALGAIAASGHPAFSGCAARHAALALRRAECAIAFQPDIDALRASVPRIQLPSGDP